MVTELARQALQPAAASSKLRNGVPLLPVNANAGPVTLDIVSLLRDESR